MQAVRPLADVLPSPVRIAGFETTSRAQGDDDGAAVERLLNVVSARIGAPAFAIAHAHTELSVFEQVVNARLIGPEWQSIAAAARSPPRADIGGIVRGAVSGTFEDEFPPHAIRSFDGAVFRAYAAGRPDRPTVVLASACGMPAKLSEGWIRQLARKHFVITWETRALFGAPQEREFDRLATDVDAQVGDLFAVMDHFNMNHGHVMGLCGGAVIALAAASARPARVSSLSLWHGDYNFSAPHEATTHQKNLRALLAMAAQDRASAASIHAIFCQSIRAGDRPDQALQTLYPYATAELLHRYAKLNGSIMDTDSDLFTARAGQPALVVTSNTDSTAHPAGSRRVAERLARATLHVEPTGDHISLFDAEPRIVELAMRFIDRQDAAAATSEATV